MMLVLLAYGLVMLLIIAAGELLSERNWRGAWTALVLAALVAVGATWFGQVVGLWVPPSTTTLL